METKPNEKCPQCGEERLRRWAELTEEDQMIVRRLPATAEYSANERETMHRWCTRCWYEETAGERYDA